MNWLSLVFTFAGLSAFALSMDVHHRSLFGRVPTASRRRHLKALGTMLHSFALSLATIVAGPGLAFVEWIAALAVSAFALTLLLSFTQRTGPSASVAKRRPSTSSHKTHQPHPGVSRADRPRPTPLHTKA